jgi:hypothetical protein
MRAQCLSCEIGDLATGADEVQPRSLITRGSARDPVVRCSNRPLVFWRTSCLVRVGVSFLTSVGIRARPIDDVAQQLWIVRAQLIDALTVACAHCYDGLGLRDEGRPPDPARLLPACECRDRWLGHHHLIMPRPRYVSQTVRRAARSVTVLAAAGGRGCGCPSSFSPAGRWQVPAGPG